MLQSIGVVSLFSNTIIRTFYLLTFLNLPILLFGQTSSKTQMFKYSAEGNFWKGGDLNSELVFLNDSVFIDYGLLGSDDTAEVCSITFKKIKSNWFIKADGEWQEFFSYSDSLIKVVYFKKEKYILKPIGHGMLYKDIYLYGFIMEDLYVYVSEINTFWFDPQRGVVIIETGGNNKLIRNDFAKIK